MIKNWQDDPTLQLVMKKIGDDYDVLSYLGGGGLARVYKVYHKLFKETRVLKIMDFHYILQLFEKSDVTDIGTEFKKIKDRFANEAKAYKKISNPGIIKVYQPGYVEYENNREKIQIPYLILEYVEGASLKAVLKMKSPLKIETVLKISGDVLSTLDAIHQKGIIHRDIKPSNIMIRAKTGEAVLIDFGLAKDLEDQESIGITVTRTAMGSAHYMPPEMYKDSKNITKETDLYSFGIILYEMVTANVPFRGNFMEVMHGHLQMPVPEAEVFNKSIFGKEIRKIIVKALAKDVKDRYRSAADFLMSLKELKVELVKSGEIDEDYFKDERKYLKEVTIGDKTRKKFYERPIVWVLSIIVATAFLLLFLKILPEVQFRKYIDAANESANSGQYSKAYQYLEKAKQIKDNPELWVLRLEITFKQKKTMKADYAILTQFLEANTTKQEKLEKSRKFKDIYREVISTEREAEINNIIAQLETWIKEDNAYQNYIAAADGYINKGDYEKASEELKKAGQISKVETAEIKARRSTIAVKKMAKDYDDLQQYLRGNAENQAKLDRCREFLDKHQNAPVTLETTSIRAETAKYMTWLQKDIRTDEQINGNQEYNTVKTNIILENYLSFKSNYPASRYLTDLKARLIKADENLPSEKYWEQGIKRNRKGYYEFTFRDNNGHRMVYIPGIRIWIDKYEVTWAQYKRFSNVQPPQGPDLYIQGGDTYPAVVSYNDAESYCKRYGLRLPTEEEWKYAAGKGESIYPWGNESPDVPAANGKWRANFLKLENGKPADGFKGTAPVDSFADFSSPFDVVNMAGNVWEWVREEFLIGGSYFSSKVEDLRIEKRKRMESADNPGFRCVKDEN